MTVRYGKKPILSNLTVTVGYVEKSLIKNVCSLHQLRICTQKPVVVARPRLNQYYFVHCHVNHVRLLQKQCKET